MSNFNRLRYEGETAYFESESGTSSLAIQNGDLVWMFKESEDGIHSVFVLKGGIGNSARHAILDASASKTLMDRLRPSQEALSAPTLAQTKTGFEGSAEEAAKFMTRLLNKLTKMSKEELVGSFLAYEGYMTEAMGELKALENCMLSGVSPEGKVGLGLSRAVIFEPRSSRQTNKDLRRHAADIASVSIEMLWKARDCFFKKSPRFDLARIYMKDSYDLLDTASLLHRGRLADAYEKANSLDTEAREAFPHSFWNEWVLASTKESLAATEEKARLERKMRGAAQSSVKKKI